MTKDIKILLVQPPAQYAVDHVWLPLGIAYLGSSLKRRGYAVSVRDMRDYSWSQVEREIKKIDPDVLGISCLTRTRMSAVEIAKVAKRCNHSMKIIMGGAHASVLPEQMLQLAPIDVVVLGEGEITTIELIDAIAQGNDYAKVKGIIFQSNGKVVRTEPRPFIRDLDALPFPMYEDFDLQKYKETWVLHDDGFQPLSANPKISAIVVTSRGCPFNCQFCSTRGIWGRYWRARSPKNVVDELQWLNDTYGIEQFTVMDDIFTVNKKRVIEICKEIVRRGLDIIWYTETRVDCVDREMLGWMKKAGCYDIEFGIESGSPLILRTINKGFTVEQIKDAFKATRETGLEACALLMVGNPNESEQTIDETIKLMGQIDWSDFTTRLTLILPGTHLYGLAKSKGIISDDYWLSDNHPNTERGLPVYTAEHSIHELRLLDHRLRSGILKRRSTWKYLRYVTGGICHGLFNKPEYFFPMISQYLKRRLGQIKKLL